MVGENGPGRDRKIPATPLASPLPPRLTNVVMFPQAAGRTGLMRCTVPPDSAEVIVNLLVGHRIDLIFAEIAVCGTS